MTAANCLAVEALPLHAHAFPIGTRARHDRIRSEIEQGRKLIRRGLSGTCVRERGDRALRCIARLGRVARSAELRSFEALEVMRSPVEVYRCQSVIRRREPVLQQLRTSA